MRAVDYHDVFTRKPSVREIEDLIDAQDTGGSFDTRHKWHVNFVRHFNQILGVGQLIAFYEGEKLIGFCSWVLCNDVTRHAINKVKWEIPYDITVGDTLYIDVCVLTKGAEIYSIKKILREKCRKLNIVRVFWYDIPHRKIFSSQLKGDRLCQTVAA